MPHIQLVVIQPTPFCNIDCRYCYLPDRGNKAMLAEATIANLFTQIFASGWLQQGVTVVWHAGEPMVLPIDFYRQAFQLIDRLKPPDIELTHAFQTNGTLIDDAWCAFFTEANVNIGVSVDGPQRLHDINRRTRAGRGTFDKTIAGIRRLRRHNVPFHVISVLSAESLAAPSEMFDFYVSEGIDRVCFNVEESEGDHVSRSFGATDIEGSYYRFLREFWRLTAAAPGKFSFVREIDDATRLVLRPNGAVFFNQLVEPFAITSMDWTGNVATFSPELLGLKNSAYGDFILGNINRDTLADMAESAVLQRMRRDIDAGVALCRERCEYFSICGGGEPVNKLAENGTFVSTETTYCRMTKMRATDLVLDLIERVGDGATELSELGMRSLGAAPLAGETRAAAGLPVV
jgi:uncharacterized protein